MLAGFFPANRPTVLGTITGVDEESRTCVLDDDGVLMPGIRLQAVTGGDKGILIVPKIGALALAVRVEESEDWMLIDCSEIEKISIVVGGSTVELTNELIQFNGGKLGGMAKVAMLTTKLNGLERDINTLKTVFSGWTPVMEAKLKAEITTWATAPLTVTSQSEIENKKITH